MPLRLSFRRPLGMAEPPKLEPEQLRQSPELAILEAADAVLDTALAALVAANPALLGTDPFERRFDDAPLPPQRLFAADALLTAAHALRSAIHRYCSAVDFEPDDAEELE